MTRQLLLAIVLVAVGLGPASADPTWEVAGSASSYSYVCGGDDWLAINGKGNNLHITGDCALLEINGSDNKISVESVASIRITGHNNDIRYVRAPDGKKPAITNQGAANTIRRVR
jgi:hypothetical protein